MTDHKPGVSAQRTPDYDLPDALSLTDPGQYKALFEETRQRIVWLLLERAATTSELAQVLGKPKGTVGHHLKVLEQAGLIRVVRTKRVRALEAKYYGRTARVFYFERTEEAVGQEQRAFQQAAAEVAAALARGPAGEDEGAPDEAFVNVNRREARVPLERAQEFSRRLNDLMVEFTETPRGGRTTFALIFGLYSTDLPALPEEQR